MHRRDDHLSQGFRLAGEIAKELGLMNSVECHSRRIHVDDIGQARGAEKFSLKPGHRECEEFEQKKITRSLDRKFSIA